MNYPRLCFVISAVLLWVAAQCGAALGRRKPLKEGEREDFTVVQSATLTLLGLIIGFSFSMAITRYDLRKNYEEAEANAIGTEYFRVGLLPATDSAAVRADLRQYTNLRIEFYRTRAEEQLERIGRDTTELQKRMWHAVESAAMAQPSVLNSLAVAGMNDVLNSQGYTQAAWWNRIPPEAWVFLLLIAISCNVLVGYGAHNAGIKAGLLFVLPLVVATSFLLIADIDSPRRGFIAVSPQNLASLAESLNE